MKKSKILTMTMALTALSLLVGGCFTLSVNPLYTEDDLVGKDEFNPNLVGVWGDPDKPEMETWQFSEGEGATYRLIIREEPNLLVDPESDGIFEAHLLRLGDHLFLDLFPEEPESVNEFYKAHVIPAHSFLKVKLEGHALTLTHFSYAWLEDAIEQGGIDIDHQRRDDLIVLVATTPELQELVLAHVDEAFEEPEVIFRLQ